jgi:hypothetical protein
MDIAEIGGNNYLIIIDYYSRWIEIVKLENKTSDAIIDVLRDLFSKFGIPNEIIADNMPFSSLRFHEFAKSWEFKITTSSPYYSQRNEKGVGIAKNMLKISQYTGKSIFEHLLAYSNTPITGLSVSPAQLLQSRELKSPLAVNRERQLKPEIKEVYDEILKIKDKQKQWYDTRAKKTEDTYYVGQSIYVQDKFNKMWRPAITFKKLSEPRSYLIKYENEKIFRRNSRWIKEILNNEVDLSLTNNENNMTEEKHISDEGRTIKKI